jgi:hypothetical protein
VCGTGLGGQWQGIGITWASTNSTPMNNVYVCNGKVPIANTLSNGNHTYTNPCSTAGFQCNVANASCMFSAGAPGAGCNVTCYAKK